MSDQNQKRTMKINLKEAAKLNVGKAVILSTSKLSLGQRISQVFKPKPTLIYSKNIWLVYSIDYSNGLVSLIKWNPLTSVNPTFPSHAPAPIPAHKGTNHE